MVQDRVVQEWVVQDTVVQDRVVQNRVVQDRAIQDSGVSSSSVSGNQGMLQHLGEAVATLILPLFYDTCLWVWAHIRRRKCPPRGYFYNPLTCSDFKLPTPLV